MTQATTMRARELPQTDRESARTNLTAEYAALLATVDALDAEDWARPTDCLGWTVRDVVAHLAGAAECGARTASMLRHYGYAGWKSARRPVAFVDHMCASQIAARSRLSDAELAGDLRRWSHLTQDTVRYLRLLSGRSDECTLDAAEDPAAIRSLRTARVVF